MVLAKIMAFDVLAPFVVGTTAITGTAGGAAAVGKVNFGEKMKNLSPISYYKLWCFRTALRSKWNELHKDCTEIISQEIKEIHEDFSKKLTGLEYWERTEIKRLNEESRSLSEMIRKIVEGSKSLDNTGNKIDTLLAE